MFHGYILNAKYGHFCQYYILKNQIFCSVLYKDNKVIKGNQSTSIGKNTKLDGEIFLVQF